jgi:hypothetical protein
MKQGCWREESFFCAMSVLGLPAMEFRPFGSVFASPFFGEHVERVCSFSSPAAMLASQPPCSYGPNRPEPHCQRCTLKFCLLVNIDATAAASVAGCPPRLVGFLSLPIAVAIAVALNN